MPDEINNSVLHHVRRLFGAAAGDGPADVELLGRFTRDRDEAAFELLVWRHAELVLTACRQLLRDHHAAEDAFQATFLVLFRKAGSVRKGEALAAWLHRVACRVALRARAGTTCSEASLDDLPGRPMAPGIDEDLSQALHEEIGHLPAYYRAVIVCCYLEGRTHEEAARVLGWSKGTVAGRAARAKEILRRRLTSRGVAPGAALPAMAGASASLAGRVGNLMTGLRAGAGEAVGLSPRAVLLAEGVMGMFGSKMKGAALALLAVGLVGLGFALGMGREGDKKAPPDKAPPAKDKVAAKAGDPLDEALRRAEVRRNLRQIADAVRQYDQDKGFLPLPAITDADSKPLLSWRVELLPYLGHEMLYKQFKRDEAWDSAHNKKLLDKMPSVYAAVSPKAAEGATNYQYVVGPGALFTSHRLRDSGKLTRRGRLSETGDLLPARERLQGIAPATTMLVVEASKAVPWTKPDDVAYDPKMPVTGLGGAFPTTFHAVPVQGRVWAVSRRLDQDTMRLLITPSSDKRIASGLFSDAVLGGGSPIEKAALKRLQDKNQRLRDEAAALTEVLGELRDEVKALRWVVEADEAVKAHPEGGKLLKHNTMLEKALQEGRDEAKKLLAEVERLKKAAKKEKK